MSPRRSAIRALVPQSTTSIERYPGYTIAIVEFDDQGRFWDYGDPVLSECLFFV
jgi:hypothetical protein